jgi:hypothetical protein
MKSLTMKQAVRLKEVHSYKAEKQARDGRKQPIQWPKEEDETAEELLTTTPTRPKNKLSGKKNLEQAKCRNTKRKEEGE